MLIKQCLYACMFCLLLSACATPDHPLAGTPQLSDEDKGVRYLLGRGVVQDDDKAFYYFQRAAQTGNPFAQNELAYLYFTGKGTTANAHKAFYWYKATAQQGLSSAQYNVGLMYEWGLGVARDLAQAQFWYEKSASNGFAPAKKALMQLKVKPHDNPT